MKIRRLIVMAAALASALLAGGCATSRSEVRLAAPGAAAAAAPAAPAAGAKVAVIRSVKDERVFEQAPAEPSTPSLGFEGADQATGEVKARAIGRKRNSWGKALGDILLQPGQTVEGVVRENLGAALRDAGFDVRDDAGSAAAPLLLDVRIQRFWAWMQPGFWAITLKARIATELQVSAGDRPVNIAVEVEDPRGLATDGAWIETIDKGLVAFRREAAAKLAALK